MPSCGLEAIETGGCSQCAAVRPLPQLVQPAATRPMMADSSLLLMRRSALEPRPVMPRGRAGGLAARAEVTSAPAPPGAPWYRPAVVTPGAAPVDAPLSAYGRKPPRLQAAEAGAPVPVLVVPPWLPPAGACASASPRLPPALPLVPAQGPASPPLSARLPPTVVPSISVSHSGGVAATWLCPPIEWRATSRPGRWWRAARACSAACWCCCWPATGNRKAGVRKNGAPPGLAHVVPLATRAVWFGEREASGWCGCESHPSHSQCPMRATHLCWCRTPPRHRHRCR